MINKFSDEHKVFFMKFMEWFWKSMQITDPNFMIPFRTVVSIRDYDFIYALWSNGVSNYDDTMQKRLNKLRKIYIANN
jgi:hypothetical protein